MFIIQNALKNIIRNIGRNALITIIIFAIVGTSVIALIINNTANGIIDNYKNQFGSKVTIGIDMEKLMADNSGQQGQGQGPQRITRSNLDTITTDQYIEFSQSDYLQKTIFTAQAQGSNENLKAVDEDEQQQGNMIIRGQDGTQQSGEMNFTMPTLSIRGNSDVDNLEYFTDNTRFIEEGDGRMYEADNECIISAELAELNNIAVGDTITINSSMFTMGGSDEESVKTYELTVVGIYTDLTEEYSSDMPFASAMMNTRNQILTSFETLADTTSEERSGVTVNAEYYLKSPDLLDNFREELTGKGLPDSYKVSTDEESYNTIVGPVIGLKGFAFAFMFVVLILGAVILMLLSTIAMRERKYEIGVLRAMGMKKGKVALGLISEMIFITGACLILGLSAGGVAAQSVSDILLEQQLASVENTNNNQNGNNTGIRGAGGGGTLMRIGANRSDAKPLEDMDVGIGFDTIWQIVLISLLIAGIASVVGIMNVTRYEPMKILSNRN